MMLHGYVQHNFGVGIVVPLIKDKREMYVTRIITEL